MKNLIKIIICLYSITVIGQDNPNIVFLFADDLGHGEISFNSSTYSTPNIDSLCENGAYFSRFYSRPVCTPSRFSLMTGNYPFELFGNGDYHVQFQFDEEYGLHPDTVTLPEQLQEYGYYTMHLGKWHLGSSRPEMTQLKNGFNKYFGSNLFFTSMKPGEEINNIPTWSYNQSLYSSLKFATDVQTDTAVTWIAQQAKDTTAPFFLYFAYTNPHDHAASFGGSDTIPYTEEDFALAPGGYTTSQKRKWANIYNMDRSVGRIIDTLSTLGIDNNTIVIFASDNGGDDTNDADNSPFNGDKGELTEGGVRVPFVWYQPGVVDSMTIDSLCALEDILPTLIEGVLGGSVRRPVDGVNFHPLLSGTPISMRDYVGPIITGRCWSVYRGSIWKLVNNKTATITGNSPLSDNIELFDMQNDQGETTDVSATYPDIVTELTAVKNAAEVNKQSERTVGSSEPPGWQYPRWWGDPNFWYSPNYLYQILQIDKQ